MGTWSSSQLVIESESSILTDVNSVGAKAAGLSNFPSTWVPNFFIISKGLFEKWCRLNNRNASAISKQILKEEERKILADAIKNLGISSSGKVIVRSSSSMEGLEARGQFISRVSEATPEGILESCCYIYEHAHSEHRRKYSDSSHLALIVQLYVEPRAMGHLSNERRVAKRRQEWLYEFEPIAVQPFIGRFAIKRNTARANRSPLIANAVDGVIRRLRTVAATINDKGLRLHMEWVWDGKNLWIVQGDRDLEERVSKPRADLVCIQSPKGVRSLRSLVSASNVTHHRWRKVQCHNNFEKAGLPSAPIWVLQDALLLSGLQKNRVGSELKSDIRDLLSSPVVVRMDTKVDRPGEMLPRSDCLKTPQQVEEFLVEHARGMKERGIGPKDFCFMIHHYIPSRSSAFCLAYPNLPKVLIDSIWGLPDGLLFYSHDSFELDPDDIETLRKSVRFKDNCLAPSQDGQWIRARIGRPWDWASSIDIGEMLSVGKYTKKLAEYEKRPVQVMWFIGIPSSLNLPPLLPWWYKSEEPPGHIDGADPRVFRRNRIFISTWEDLDEIRAKCEPAPEGSVLRMTPGPTLLRDEQFLNAIATLAKERNIPVELQGSPLGHAYYRLRSLAVQVQCTEIFSFKPSFRGQRFEKLVRDRIPLLIEERGEHVWSVAVTGEDLSKVLKAKVVEESLELQSATRREDILEELADILEVVSSLAEHVNLTMNDVKKKAKQKRSERGGFSEGLVLVETKEVPLIDMDKSSVQVARRGAKAGKMLTDGGGGGLAKVTTRRIPKRYDSKIIIPIVPPDIKDFILRLEELGVTVKIRYESKDIVLSWTPEVTQPSRQADLFEFTNPAK
jgi:predicted house-cleaning noncanonical NTP pyrophosphatase (MazG superfamily)